MSRVNLYPNAKLTLSSAKKFTEQGDSIFVNGVSFSENPSILEFNGASATAIPEGNAVLFWVILVFFLVIKRNRS